MVAAPPHVLTLSPDEISRFLMRTRRQREAAGWEGRLDLQLREILERANDFVPSVAGSILLDDPRAKFAGAQVNRLTFIAVFGPTAPHLLGRRIPATRGIAGRVYSTGEPYMSPDLSTDPYFAADFDEEGVFLSKSIVGVPVIVGESICGVLELVNRLDGLPYEPRDLELLRIFAGYISSSIQNALDAIRAKELARRDDLTGLFNDRFLHAKLCEEIEQAESDGTDLALLFLDLDDFKKVNDTHGHLAGSRTLAELGRLILEVTPPGAICARYGGDEFVIVLPGADATLALDTAEEIRNEIASHTFLSTEDPAGRPPINLTGLTASVGIASYHEHVASRGEPERRENALLRLADQAMYDAKHQGKNRVVVAEPE